MQEQQKNSLFIGQQKNEQQFLEPVKPISISDEISRITKDFQNQLSMQSQNTFFVKQFNPIQTTKATQIQQEEQKSSVQYQEPLNSDQQINLKGQIGPDTIIEQINSIFKKILSTDFLDKKFEELQNVEDIRPYLLSHEYFNETLKRKVEELVSIIGNSKIDSTENYENVLNKFSLNLLSGEICLKQFLMQVQEKLFNNFLSKQMEQLLPQYYELNKKKPTSKKQYFREQISSLNLKEDIESIHQFLIRNRIELIYVFFYKEVKPLKKLLGITSSLQLMTTKEIIEIKTKMINKYINSEHFEQSTSYKTPDVEKQKYQKTQIKILYILLRLGHYQFAFQKLANMKKYNQEMLDDNFYNEITKFILNNAEDKNFILFIKLLQVETIEEIIPAIQKWKLSLKEDNVSTSDLEIFEENIHSIIQVYGDSIRRQNKDNNQQEHNRMQSNQNNRQYGQSNQENNNNQNNNNHDNFNNENNQNDRNSNLFKQQQQLNKQKKKQSQNQKFMLSLDGGGIKGLIQLYYLVVLEKLTNKKCDEIFYFIGGTSIGGIIALALRIRKPAQDILGIMLGEFSKEIFNRNMLSFATKNFFKPSYFNSFSANSKLIKIMKDQIFGPNDTLETIQKNTLVTSAYLNEQGFITPVCFVKFKTNENSDNNQIIHRMYEIKSSLNNQNKPVEFLKNLEQNECNQYAKAPLYEIAASSSAAFPFLNAYQFQFAQLPQNHKNRVYVDGGYLFNNVDILLIEFIKQIDKFYIRNHRFRDYVLLSLGNSPDNIPQVLQQQIDKQIKLPKQVIKLKIKGKEIEEKSDLNKNLSIYLAKQEPDLTYIRESPKYEKEIVLDDVSYESIERIQEISHSFKLDCDWESITDLLNCPQDVDFESIENFENLQKSSFSELNQFLAQIKENIINQKLIQDYEIRKPIDELSIQCGSEVINIQQQLLKLMSSIKIKDLENKKMIDSKNQFDTIFSYVASFIFSQYYEDKKAYENQQFKGVLQFASGLGSIQTMSIVLSIMEQYFGNGLTNEVKKPIGNNKWNPLISAAANNQILSFIYLHQRLYNNLFDENLIIVNEKYFFNAHQIKDDELKKEIIQNISQDFQQYKILKKNNNNVYDVSNSKFRRVINWYFNLNS